MRAGSMPRVPRSPVARPPWLVLLLSSAALSCTRAAAPSAPPSVRPAALSAPAAPPSPSAEEAAAGACRVVDTTVDLRAGAHVRPSAEGPAFQVCPLRSLIPAAAAATGIVFPSAIFFLKSLTCASVTIGAPRAPGPARSSEP